MNANLGDLKHLIKETTGYTTPDGITYETMKLTLEHLQTQLKAKGKIVLTNTKTSNGKNVLLG